MDRQEHGRMILRYWGWRSTQIGGHQRALRDNTGKRKIYVFQIIRCSKVSNSKTCNQCEKIMTFSTILLKKVRQVFF